MKIVDAFRAVYINMPEDTKRIINPLLSVIPVDILYGKSYRHTYKRIEQHQCDPVFIHEFQRNNLNAILRVVLEKSPFYKDHIPESVKSNFDKTGEAFDVWSCLPILTKDRIRDQIESMCITNPDSLDLISTSGSSGKPFAFYLDKDRSPKEWAFINYIWSKTGYKPTQRRAVLRGTQFSPDSRKTWHFDPALRELRLSPFNLSPKNIETYLDLIKEYQIDYIHGYPSAITLIARQAISSGWKPPKHLKGILLISETLFPAQREIMFKAFGRDISCMPFYGMSEKVVIAGELPGCPDVYEFEPLYGLAELVDEAGQSVFENGKKGRIIGTGFISTGMPLIRYDTGDTGYLEQIPSRENGYRLRVKGIRSRWGQEFLVSREMTLISMTAINIHSENYPKIQEFQFFQDTPGIAILKIVPKNNQLEFSKRFVEEVQKKVGKGLTIRMQIVESISVNSRAKRPFIDQKLNINQFISSGEGYY
jgi:phenylacetate-CoA ligase